MGNDVQEDEKSYDKIIGLLQERSRSSLCRLGPGAIRREQGRTHEVGGSEAAAISTGSKEGSAQSGRHQEDMAYRV